MIGGARHLALAAPLAGETQSWPSPLSEAVPAILAQRGRRVCVLATGDPLHYGVGVTLAQAVPAAQMLVFPQPSAFALACARLGWAQQDCALVSLHGRPLERILPHLQPGARVLALSWDETTPGKLAAYLAARGFGRSRLTVLEALGGPRERIRSLVADGFAADDFAANDFAANGFAANGLPIDPLNLVAIEVETGSDARVLPLACGLDDDWFAHDGQLTKADIRAITLAPRAGQMLWDIGAGSGSIGLEWCLRHPRNRAIAFEENPARLARVAENRAALGALAVTIVAGAAPASLAGQPAPDAVFIGGGIADAGVFEAAWTALAPGGRLVANVVTLEGEARVAALFQAHGGTLRRLGIAHLDKVGTMHGWRSAMPVTQWRVVKP